MYARHLAPCIQQYVQEYPIIALVGPRQSGKTTLAKHLFPHYSYISLENVATRRLAAEDPTGFLKTHGALLIIDEAQHVPELFSSLQEWVDENGEPGQFILTGSSQFLLIEGISQSLAGRIATFTLFPFSWPEIERSPRQEGSDTIFRSFHKDRSPVSHEDLLATLLRGSYPRIYDKQLDSAKWYENYIFTYVERDVRMSLNVRNTRTFEHFLLLCASRSGHLLDYSDLSNALGIAVATVKEWIAILEASGIIFLLPPFFQNYSKRLVKRPKLYFIDTGILCHLLSIETTSHLKGHPLLGSLFETFIISDCYKRFTNSGKRPPLYFWRDRSGNEIDLLLYDGVKGFPIEIKLSHSFHPEYRKNISRWLELSGNRADRGLILYCGAHAVQLDEPIPALPWYTV